MFRRLRWWLCVLLVWFASGCLATITTGPRSAIQWTTDIIQCPLGSLVVLEEAFYTNPSPQVCDEKCRHGPATVANQTGDDLCYFFSTSCVQVASEEDVSRLYDWCRPTPAPTRCSFSGTGLPESLNVGYSCMGGAIFDPYNRTFSWRANRVVFAFQHESSPFQTLASHCQVRSDSPRPTLKITALKSPRVVPERNDTTDWNDVTFVVGEVRTTVMTSRFPRWWEIKEQHFVLEFTMVVTKEDLHPFWVMVEDRDNKFEILCKRVDVTTTSTTTTTRATSAPVSVSNRPTSDEGISFYSLKDIVLAVAGSVAAVTIIAVTICLVQRRRSRRREREENFSSLIPRVEFHNNGADSSAHFTHTNNAINTDRTACSQRPSLSPPPAPFCSPPVTPSPPPCSPSPYSPFPSSRLPPGASLSNQLYTDDQCHEAQPAGRGKSGTDESGYLTPRAAGASASGGTKSGDDTNEYEEIPAFAAAKGK